MSDGMAAVAAAFGLPVPEGDTLRIRTGATLAVVVVPPSPLQSSGALLVRSSDAPRDLYVLVHRQRNGDLDIVGWASRDDVTKNGLQRTGAEARYIAKTLRPMRLLVKINAEASGPAVEEAKPTVQGNLF